DDPYHRARWTEPYPRAEWQALLKLIRQARKCHIDFAYGFHPGMGLRFSNDGSIHILLEKARRFYDAGVRTFAILFDDIPSRLEHARDRRLFQNSLARAEGTWLRMIGERQPISWKQVEWWICPSYYTPDPLLSRVFGSFECDFLEILGEQLPPDVACFWTGPSIVSQSINLAHVRSISRRLRRPLMLWDNYPVNDLSMKDEMHLGPLTGRDPRLPDVVYGYFNNPLLQEALSFIPLASCFDYARDPSNYDPESSWSSIISERFGRSSLPHWQAVRFLGERLQSAKKPGQPVRLTKRGTKVVRAAHAYLERHRQKKWARELRPWLKRILEEVKV
ncbi:MAG: beta-N-acetylglucosaminidase domain-containing protein, partial [Candidatus Binatia bacterium]